MDIKQKKAIYTYWGWMTPAPALARAYADMPSVIRGLAVTDLSPSGTTCLRTRVISTGWVWGASVTSLVTPLLTSVAPGATHLVRDGREAVPALATLTYRAYP